MQATYKVLNVLETIETEEMSEINVMFNPMPLDPYFNRFHYIQKIDDINL